MLSLAAWGMAVTVWYSKPTLLVPLPQFCCLKAKLKRQENIECITLSVEFSSYHDCRWSEIILLSGIVHFLTNLSDKRGGKKLWLAYSRPSNLFWIPFPHTATASYFLFSHSHPEAMSACHLDSYSWKIQVVTSCWFQYLIYCQE